LRFETIRIMHSGDMAIETGRYSLAVSQANGAAVAQRGKYVRAWRRLGAWLIVAECWNSNLPFGN
jgi:ketosteroid isomerase-like protein